MKNKLLKYTFASVLFLFTIFGITKVNAEQYTGQAIWPSEAIPNIYIRKERPDGYRHYRQAKFLRRSEDNKFVYCVQPYVEIDNNLPYYNVERSDFATVLNMTKDQWNRISLLAYYGYGYNDNGYDHSAQKWYAITQVLIWRIAEPTSNIYFTDTLNGNKLPDKFASEIAELNALVDSHYTKPSFNTNGITAVLGQTITLTDNNGVLSNYKIASTTNVNATISGNTLSITPTAVGNAEITFVKNATNYDTPPVVYFSDHSQNVFRPGNYDPVNSKITFKVAGGSVALYKSDVDTKYSQGDATLEGAIYEIYDTNYNLITTLVTDKNGYSKTEKILFPNKEYILKEKKASTGYLLDDKEYRFTLTESNLDIKLDVYEKVIEKDFEIFKVKADGTTTILKAETNVTIEFYLKSNNKLYKKGTTDSKGHLKVTLPYGTYVVHQATSTSNYEKINDFEVVINEQSDELITKVISNAEITAKLKLVKVDSESKKQLVRDGIKFKIKNLDTNEYVCQSITYPNQEKVCVFETSDGMFTTPYVLSSGNYQIEELEDQIIDGYVWNSTPLKFSITENSNFIYDDEFGVMLEVQFSNKQVKGEFEVTKTGEKMVVENGTFAYEEILLSDIVYDLYADGDIYSQDGTLIYKDKELINTFKTIDGKYKVSNLYLGNYCLVERETLENHILDSTPYCFTLSYKDQYTDIVSIEFTLKNYLIKNDFELTKVDFSTGKVIKGALIEIYNENDELVFSDYTDEDGKIYVKDLGYGKYKFIEKEAPDGYILNSEEHYFEILETGEIIKDTLSNTMITGDFELTKIDISTGEVIKGALIEIYNENNELVFSDYTDEDGKIYVKGLTYGKYKFIEKEAPDGYILNTEEHYFEILEDGQIVKDTLSNEKIIIEVPNTSVADSKVVTIVTLVSIIAGIGFIIYDKKRKK